MKATEFDTKFDDGEDITNFLDLSQAKHSGDEHKSINIDFPTWMIAALDQEARRLGVPRQAIIKVWISDRLANLPH
jgi:macrodomain Ter protein organizer (MatP/YcbG family)